MSGVDILKILTYWVFRAVFVLAAIAAVFKHDWVNLVLIVVTLSLTFLPVLMEKKFQVDYPSEGEITILVFIFLSMYLGEVHTFYAKIWWWDLMLHAFSGLIIADIGFILVYVLNQRKELSLKPIFIVIFSFSFAMTLGVGWEFFEFAMDSFFGLNMQKSGLTDTMWDLIFVAIGAWIVAVAEYYYLQGKFMSKSLKKMEQKFFDDNKSLFK